MGGLVKEPSTDSRCILPVWAQVALGAWMAVVTAAAFLYLPAARGFAQPEAARIVVFHVPCAIVAVAAYVVSAAYAIGYLRGRRLISDARCAASAGLGLLFTILATCTGMVFAHAQWGAAWNWDPRQTSIVMLMLVYAAYFALRGAIKGARVRARITASYSILAGLVMPYLVFVLPRLAGGLHPSNTLTQRGGLSPEYRVVLVGATLGFVWLFVWLLRIETRICEHALESGASPAAAFVLKETD